MQPSPDSCGEAFTAWLKLEQGSHEVESRSLLYSFTVLRCKSNHWLNEKEVKGFLDLQEVLYPA